MTDPKRTNPDEPRPPIGPFSDLLQPLVEQLNAMDATAMRAWVGGALSERTSLPRPLPDDSPVPTLVALDPLLDDIHRDHLRRAMRDAVLDALSNAPEGQPLCWLLLILTRLEDRGIRDVLVRFVRGGPFAALPPDAKCRVLSTIIDLHYWSSDLSFWKDLLADPDAAALSGLVFHAIADQNVAEAVALLPDLPADARTLNHIALGHLPLLWDVASPAARETVRQSLVAMHADSRPELRQALDTFAEVSDVDLSPAPVTSDSWSMLDKFLAGLNPPIGLQPMAAGIAA